ncbi:MAG: DUF4388 domain-containing protein [Longimicrobiaceae bacterium]
MAIEGPLSELGLSDVFQLLDLSRKTGVLKVSSGRGGNPAVIRFDQGAVVGAEIPGNQGRLGHLLLRAGKVTEHEIELAFREQRKQPGTPLGRILVKHGFASEEDVKRQLRFQIEQSIFELIRWQDGYFRFEEIPPSNGDSLSVRIPTESLLMEAARRIDEWTTLEARIASVEVVPALTGGDGEDGTSLDLRPDEWEVLAEIDGALSIRRIAAEVGRSEFEVAKVVYGLLSTGVVEVSDSAPGSHLAGAGASLREGLGSAEAALEKGDAPQAQRVLESLAADFPDAAELHLLSGRVLGRLGRWREAVEQLSRAVELDPLAAGSHYHLGFAAARTGELLRAEDAWATYLRLPDPEPGRRERALRAAKGSAALRAALDQDGDI